MITDVGQSGSEVKGKCVPLSAAFLRVAGQIVGMKHMCAAPPDVIEYEEPATSLSGGANT